MKYQPRFVAYARAQGRTPEEQLAAQDNNLGFMLWISEQHGLYCEEHGIRRDSAEHRAASRGTAFDEWLNRQTVTQQVLEAAAQQPDRVNYHAARQLVPDARTHKIGARKCSK